MINTKGATKRKIIIEAIKESKFREVNIEEICKKTGLKRELTIYYLNDLIKQNKVCLIKRGKFCHYKIMAGIE